MAPVGEETARVFQAHKGAMNDKRPNRAAALRAVLPFLTERPAADDQSCDGPPQPSQERSQTHRHPGAFQCAPVPPTDPLAHSGGRSPPLTAQKSGPAVNTRFFEGFGVLLNVKCCGH